MFEQVSASTIASSKNWQNCSNICMFEQVFGLYHVIVPKIVKFFPNYAF